MHERYFGKYKDNLEGFKDEITRIHSSKVKGEKNIMLEQQKSYDQLLQNIKQFDLEISMQMKLKINDKIMFEKKEKQDFVKLGRSETSVYRDQIESYSDTIKILKKDNEWLLNAGDNFDKAAKKQDDEQNFDKEKYSALKKEIKMKKEAKERLLQQGFPEFKSYLRL